MRLHHLEARHGDTSFAFLVLRLRKASDRDAIVALIQKIAPMVPDAEAFIAELPEDLEESMKIVGMPWLPADDDDGLEEQQALLAQASEVEDAWFFQTGTGLPSVVDGDDDDDEDDDGDITGERGIIVVDGDDDDEDEDDDDEDDDVVWSHGPPPQVMQVRFPVDGYPQILEELDWEDFGIAFKLAGDWQPGESTVLLGFHSLWLSPYGGRYRNAAVTIDPKHHAAHLWVDRFAVPCSAAEQVHHLLWILSKLDEITPVLHARFAGATMQQKYGGLMGDTAEPFVLGGNPLLAVHAKAGEAGVDAWIASQRGWSNEEIAQMLRELAIELVTGSDTDAGGEVDAAFDADEEPTMSVGASIDDKAEAGEGEGDEDDDDDDADDDDDDDDDEDDDDNSEGDEDEDRNRHITRHAGEVLTARAAAGLLDPRVAAALRPILAVPSKYEHRRSAVVEVLGAMKDRESVPQLIKIFDDTPITSSLDAIGKEDFLIKVASALGAIADPSAIPALSNLVRAAGDHNDKPRAPAAEALASCLAAAPQPIDDSVLASLLTPIAERNSAEANADLHFAYGRLASVLPAAQRSAARDRLAETPTKRTDATPTLARLAALSLTSGAADPAALAEMQPLIHDALTRLDYAHEYTVRNIRTALRIASALPSVVSPDDLVWLTRFTEPDIRTQAHALLAQLGRPLDAAPVFDRTTARSLADSALVQRIEDVHVVGRAALIGEAARRKLAAARPAIIAAADAAITRAREGGASLWNPDTAILSASVKALRAFALDADTISLFDRMLRHSNHHVKWELLQDPPEDERLIGGMFHVLGEKWGWQEKTAKSWLGQFQGSPAYEAERRRDDMN
ncbi:MAG: HEAT repeat domain-containing protein [Deltaproteobacteria bacterium]|nr:HEAT repeat domain-containing protein [Deltaproteobacteria bacterium]